MYVKTGILFLIACLFQVHMDLAKYHELNRFVKEGEPFDQEAALYHLSQAAKCGCLEAIKTMAQLHLGLPHDTLPDIQVFVLYNYRSVPTLRSHSSEAVIKCQMYRWHVDISRSLDELLYVNLNVLILYHYSNSS